MCAAPDLEKTDGPCAVARADGSDAAGSAGGGPQRGRRIFLSILRSGFIMC